MINRLLFPAAAFYLCLAPLFHLSISGDEFDKRVALRGVDLIWGWLENSADATRVRASLSAALALLTLAAALAVLRNTKRDRILAVVTMIVGALSISAVVGAIASAILAKAVPAWGIYFSVILMIAGITTQSPERQKSFD